jgi:hypothetical protein
MEYQEQIRINNLRWDSHPVSTFQTSLSRARGKFFM